MAPKFTRTGDRYGNAFPSYKDGQYRPNLSQPQSSLAWGRSPGIINGHPSTTPNGLPVPRFNNEPTPSFNGGVVPPFKRGTAQARSGPFGDQDSFGRNPSNHPPHPSFGQQPGFEAPSNHNTQDSNDKPRNKPSEMTPEELNRIGIKPWAANLPGMSTGFKQYVSVMSPSHRKRYMKKYGGKNGKNDPWGPSKMPQPADPRMGYSPVEILRNGPASERAKLIGEKKKKFRLWG